jgi:outer membrane lipoprotein carrier protein
VIRGWVCCLLMLLSLSLGAQTPSARKAQVVKLLQQLQSMQGKFHYRLLDSQAQLLESQSGVFAISRPQQISWQILLPYQELLVSDGRHLWRYDPSLQQASVQKLDKREQVLPLQILFAANKLPLQQLKLVDLAACQPALVSSCCLLRQRGLELFLGLQDARLNYVSFTNKEGQKLVLEFSEVIMNPNLPSTTFSFSLPSGSQLLDLR